MKENEIKLINIVREQDKPTQSLIVAINIIISYLEQHGSSPRPSSVGLRERA